MSTEEFIQFWDKSNFYAGTKIHKEDYEYLKNHLVENCHNFNDYVEKYIDKPQDTKFHPDLWPSPYCGDLRNGEIFILSLNPGFDCDYYYEKDVEVKQALKNNLSQNLTNEKYPFFVLNPRFSWIGGAKYWLKKLDKIIQKIKQDKNMNYSDILSSLSKKIVALELVPYHSKSFYFPKYQELPSVKKMLSFLNDVIIPGTKEGRYTLIILRKGKELQKSNLITKQENDNLIIYEGWECRSASLGEKSNGGNAIFKKL
ncbi:MAG: hypothetical protein E7059_01170 [Treponema bryantii]|nr:hypothetical protein [Treponema bryantii]